MLVIDVQGARQVRAQRPETDAIFVMPPSFAVLEQRLRGRSKDSEEAIAAAARVARDEVAAFAEYDYVVVNDELDAGVERLRAIVVAERARLQRDDATCRDDRQDISSIRVGKVTSVPTTFEFVVIAGARARQLLAGSTPRVTGEHKKTTLAQQEVLTKRRSRRSVEERRTGSRPERRDHRC